jgi:hypothetical protein
MTPNAIGLFSPLAIATGQAVTRTTSFQPDLDGAILFHKPETSWYMACLNPKPQNTSDALRHPFFLSADGCRRFYQLKNDPSARHSVSIYRTTTPAVTRYAIRGHTSLFMEDVGPINMQYEVNGSSKKDDDEARPTYCEFVIHYTREGISLALESEETTYTHSGLVRLYARSNDGEDELFLVVVAQHGKVARILESAVFYAI